MPEGPEIRRAADRISRVVAGQRLDRVYFAFPELKPFEAELAGGTISEIETRGKAMLTHVSNGLSIYSHNQLYGRWYTAAPGKTPTTGRSLRLALHTAAGGAFLYSASDIEVLDAGGIASHRFLSKLGPDLLQESLTAKTLVDRLEAARFAGRSLAALYLDQHFLAGLGNYLRSEILFTAGLDPILRPRDVGPDQLHRLAGETLRLGRRAYETAGVALDDEYRAPGRKGRRRQRFWVFDRDGSACYRCGSTIERETRGSRRIYRCPACQPRS